MDQLTIGLLGFFVFIALALLSVPIAYAMAIAGLGGLLLVYPIDAAFKFIPTGLFTYTSNFTLSALPLFILMGTLAFYADLGKDAIKNHQNAGWNKNIQAPRRGNNPK